MSKSGNVYLIDGVETDWLDLIQQAKDLSEEYKNDWMHTTSQAAKILRENGRIVESM